MILPLFLLIISVAGSKSSASSGQRKAVDHITALPGLTFQLPSSSQQYAGYLNASSTRFIFYWLIESQGDPSKDPIILWLGGGPGCSGMKGLFTEAGPFHVNKDDKTLWENVYTWNKIGTLLYLEGPTGVGFSYSNPKNDVTNDDRAGQDWYNALRDLFDNVFPEYQKNPFYITGESYAGVYVPVLAQNVVNGTIRKEFNGNLQGIAIGNGWLSDKHQTNSIVDLCYYHGLIGDDEWNHVKSVCCPPLNRKQTEPRCNYYQHLQHTKTNIDKPDNTTCGKLIFQYSEQWLGQIINDPYNNYLDCYAPTLSAKGQVGRELMHNYQSLMTGFTNQQTKINYDSTDTNYGFSCWGDAGTHSYLNQPVVQQALHIPKILSSNTNFSFVGCSDFVGSTYKELYWDVHTQLDYLYENSQIRMLMYNGDVDLICNFLGDEWFMNEFATQRNISVTQARGAWHYRSQIGGYVKSFDRIDVLTVKGAGHFVPESRPGPALQMMANFIKATNNYSRPSTYSTKPLPLVSPYNAGGTAINPASFSVAMLLTICSIRFTVRTP